MPTIIIKDYYHYGNCDLVKQKFNDSEVYNNNWECKLISLQLSKTHQKIREAISVIFSLNTSSLVLPYHLLPKIEIEYREMLNKGTCWIDTTQNVSSLFWSDFPLAHRNELCHISTLQVHSSFSDLISLSFSACSVCPSLTCNRRRDTERHR